MPLYRHTCRTCDLDWDETYSLTEEPPTECPECASDDVYRNVTTAGCILFKGGGWSPEGYNKEGYLDKYGKDVKVYDRKADHDREAKGEAEAAELAKQKHLDKVSKRVFGPDAGVTQADADAAVKKAGQERVK